MVNLKREGYSIAAMRQLAARTLPRPVFDFVDGAAEDEPVLHQTVLSERHAPHLPQA